MWREKIRDSGKVEIEKEGMRKYKIKTKLRKERK